MSDFNKYPIDLEHHNLHPKAKNTLYNIKTMPLEKNISLEISIEEETNTITVRVDSQGKREGLYMAFNSIVGIGFLWDANILINNMPFKKRMLEVLCEPNSYPDDSILKIFNDLVEQDHTTFEAKLQWSNSLNEDQITDS